MTRSAGHGFSGHRQDLDERRRWWTGRTRRFTSRPTSSTTAAASSRARGATTRSRDPPASAWTRTCAGCSTRPASTGWTSPYDQQTLTDAVIDLIQVNKFRACYIRPLIYRGYDSLGVNPLPARWTSRSCCGSGAAYFTKEAIEEGHRRQDLDLGAQRAEHDAGDGQERGELRQRAADQDGSDRRRLRRGHRARHRRQPQRRQRPEPVHRPRRRHLHAADRQLGAVGHHARLA